MKNMTTNSTKRLLKQNEKLKKQNKELKDDLKDMVDRGNYYRKCYDQMCQNSYKQKGSNCIFDG